MAKVRTEQRARFSTLNRHHLAANPGTLEFRVARSGCDVIEGCQQWYGALPGAQARDVVEHVTTGVLPFDPATANAARPGPPAPKTSPRPGAVGGCGASVPTAPVPWRTHCRATTAVGVRRP